MEWAPVQKQMIVQAICNGEEVEPNEKDWAVREGHAALSDGNLTITPKGLAYLDRTS